jgi:hypothetical protein
MLSITELLLLLATVSLVSIVSVRFTLQKGDQIQPIYIQAPSPSNGDDRYTRAPRPQRIWNNGQETPVLTELDQIPTRGAPESYQQMGVMVGPDGKPLPLYGRRTAPRSDKFNYYTRTDSYNPVAMPVTFKNKDCQDNAGCNELSSGDSIRISPTGESAKVTLYGFDGPRYSPDI